MSIVSKRRRPSSRSPVTRERQSAAAAVIARSTGALEPGGLRVSWSRLDEDERYELFELVDKALGESDFLDHQARLTKREAARFEQLVERAADAPRIFTEARERVQMRALAAEARRTAARPPRRARFEEEGSVRLPAEVFKHLDRPDPVYHLAHLGVLVFLVAQLENGRALTPGGRIEGIGDDAVLVIDKRLGLGARYDPDSRIDAERCLDHLATNGWIEIERRSGELRVRRGPRALGAAKRS